MNHCTDAEDAGIDCVLTVADYDHEEPGECRDCAFERRTGRRSPYVPIGVLEAMPNMESLSLATQLRRREEYVITEEEKRRWARVFNEGREERARDGRQRQRERQEDYEVRELQKSFLAFCWSQFVRRYRSEES